MTSAAVLDPRAEVEAISAALESRRDLGYEWGMRRRVPSELPAHATRVPDIRKTASEWRKAHRGLEAAETFAVCDALWDTGWREERMVAVTVVEGSKAMLAAADWPRFERWSRDLENWEHVDHLAGVTGRMLIANRTLLPQVKTLEASENPWQRRLALVTLIVAFQKGAVFQEELSSMAQRLAKDPHPLVRRAVTWARDRLSKDHADD